MEAVSLLLDPKLPWVCKIVSYLHKENVFKLVREMVTTAKVFSTVPHDYAPPSSWQSILLKQLWFVAGKLKRSDNDRQHPFTRKSLDTDSTTYWP